ncbi:chymotrypsin B-like isoform X3 [Dermacentor albipictus]|uniref:chymotrypsin B-like isoform X3 n=1 Tax=Dermacentor albipictus TaxID=60249 RepID=UPI0031FBD5B1
MHLKALPWDHSRSNKRKRPGPHQIIFSLCCHSAAACLILLPQFSQVKAQARLLQTKSTRHTRNTTCHDDCEPIAVKRRPISLSDIQARMVLGDSVSSTMYPFILKRDRKKPMHPKEPGRTCVGSVLSRRHVLTAARCIWPRKMRPVYTVYYGSAVWNDQKPTGVVRAVRHPECRSFGRGRRLVNDVAVLEIEQAFPAMLDAVSLPKDLGNITGHVVETAGWGNTDEEQQARLNHSAQLQRVALRLRSAERCKEAYPSADLKGQICATAKDGQPHLDDFGAPLLLTTDDWYVVGVFSWFRLRDFPTSPFVFASTSYHSQWIKSVIGKTSGEKKLP